MVYFNPNMQSKVAGQIKAAQTDMASVSSGSKADRAKHALTTDKAGAKFIGSQQGVLDLSAIPKEAFMGGITINYIDKQVVNNITNNGDNVNIVTGDGNTQTITNNDQDTTTTNNYNQGFGYGHCGHNYWPPYYGPPAWVGPLPPGAYMPPGIGEKPYDGVQLGLPVVFDHNAPPIQALPVPPEALASAQTGGVKPYIATLNTSEDVQEVDKTLALKEVQLEEGMA